MSDKINILLVEDSKNDAFLIQSLLHYSMPFFEAHLVHKNSIEQALSTLQKEEDEIGIILLDLNLPDAQGLQTIRAFKEYKYIPIIVVTGEKDMQLGYDVIKCGAWDFLFKEALNDIQLTKAIFFAMAKNEMLRSEDRIKNELKISEDIRGVLEEKTLELEKAKLSLTSLAINLEEEKQEALQLSSRLMSSNKLLNCKNREIEQFVFAISHDLKNPLVSISGFTDRLIKNVGNNNFSKKLHDLQRIQANTCDMSAKINDLLNLYKISYKDPELHFLNPIAIIEKEVDLIKGQLSDVNGMLEITQPAISFYANPELLGQCIANILVNAITYRSDARPLKINISFSQTDKHICLCISDNGMGIPKEYQGKVFELFERLTTIDGTGVGLAIVKAAMERQEGYVDLTSKEDEGSTFILGFLMRD